jgi:hypothetical protein
MLVKQLSNKLSIIAKLRKQRLFLGHELVNKQLHPLARNLLNILKQIENTALDIGKTWRCI